MALLTGVNLWAVLVCAVVAMVLGMAWYSQAMFGKMWMHANGMSHADMEHAQKQGMMGGMIGMLLGALITAAVMAQLIVWVDLRNWMMGAAFGVLIGIGILGTSALGAVLFEKKSWSYFWINVGYSVVQLAIYGAILASWR